MEHFVVHWDGEAFQGEHVPVGGLPDPPPGLKMRVMLGSCFRHQSDLHFFKGFPSRANHPLGEPNFGCFNPELGWFSGEGQAKKGHLGDCEGDVLSVRRAQYLESLESQVLRREKG